ncbi:hydrogen peroxide-dependent heme synthase [Ornithinimicrobium faecis]|uniref:hydrogen peroxide-dependent heme synthase n=1 Tax=Ornithinimicrobium faecis TaxID=2934158 RepID=UPI002FCAA195
MTDHPQAPAPNQPPTDAHTNEGAVVDSERINSEVRYAMYSVFRTVSPLGADRDHLTREVAELLASVEDEGVVVRGIYDVSGLRADADFMIWWHAETVELLQSAYQRLRRTQLGAQLEPVWSNVAIHRPAEFNRGHIPAFLSGEEPRAYACVYPFVRSYEWYVLPEEERRAMLREHGMAAKDYKDVRANTLASFALGDYEWLLAFEADELHRIVDLMRELRAVDARRHVREEVPFYTGPRVDVAALVASLP